MKIQKRNRKRCDQVMATPLAPLAVLLGLVCDLALDDDQDLVNGSKLERLMLELAHKPHKALR